MRRWLVRSLVRLALGYDLEDFWVSRRGYHRARTVLGRTWHKLRHARVCRQFNCVIPIDVLLPESTVFPHGLNGVFVSSGATFGPDCIVFQQVTVGSNTLVGTKKPGAPRVGRGVLLGAGAKVIGGLSLGDDVRVGANCVVVEDVPAGATVVLHKPRLIARSEARRVGGFRTWAEYEAEESPSAE